jgi:hypothetical protein
MTLYYTKEDYIQHHTTLCNTIYTTLYRVSKKTLWKFNRLSCIINVAKQFNFYIGRKNSYLAFE